MSKTKKSRNQRIIDRFLSGETVKMIAAKEKISRQRVEFLIRGGDTLNLFQLGQFTLYSGAVSDFKIDCDALSDADWGCLGTIAARMLLPFRAVNGVPRGGLKFADALRPRATGNRSDPMLIVDDVLTTGRSMIALRDSLQRDTPDASGFIGCVLFARGPCPDWVQPLLALHPRLHLPRDS